MHLKVTSLCRRIFAKINSYFMIRSLIFTTTCYLTLLCATSLFAQEKHYTKERLSNNVNSVLTDMSPSISPDGKTLYFIVEAAPENYGVISGAKEDDQDAFYSQLQPDGTWGKRVHFPKPINNRGYNRILTSSADNNTLIVKNLYDDEGEPDGEGISISNRTENGWTIPKAIKIKDLVNKNRYSNFTVSSDLQVLISAIETDDSYGDQDLYVSLLNEDGEFSEPKNMGKVINTATSDMAPFLAADGKTLYFSSNGHGGFGDNDIFFSKRLDDSWTNWSEPVNLGPDINGPDWDSYFVLPASGEYAYMVSTTEGTNEDIYRIKLKEEAKPDPVVLVSGKVLDCKTKMPLSTTITYRDLTTDKELGSARSNPTDGSYKIVLPAGKSYSFFATKANYYPISNSVDATKTEAYKEITQDLLLCPIEVGETIRINNIFFEFAKADLKAESYPELDRVVKFLNTNSSISIQISGHTDNVGSEADNLKLSDARAASVVTYLTSKGIDAPRLTSKGYGKSKPVASNDNDEGRAMNRRVEFTIVKK